MANGPNRANKGNGAYMANGPNRANNPMGLIWLMGLIGLMTQWGL